MQQVKNDLQRITELESVRGVGTSLISLYVSGGSDLSGVKESITKELSASSNIKSKSVRKEVQSSLRSLQNYVKGITCPDRGIAIFAGANQLV